jgi:hypothetical protein
MSVSYYINCCSYNKLECFIEPLYSSIRCNPWNFYAVKPVLSQTMLVFCHGIHMYFLISLAEKPPFRKSVDLDTRHL